MDITVNCPSCSTSFPVDTNKVPDGGVRARCSACGDIFRVERPEQQIPSPISLSEPALESEPEMPVFDESVTEPSPDFETDAAAEADFDDEETGDWVLERTDDIDPDTLSIDPVGTVESAVAEARADESLGQGYEAPDLVAPIDVTPAEAPAAPEAQPEPEAPAVSGFSFGKRDPKERARRLARVLVSDMISYNSERHERALANGSLKADFEEEIEKSWKEYVEQVGEEMANGNPFWVEALNDVLAKGEQIF